MRWRRLALLAAGVAVVLLVVAWLGEDGGGIATEARTALRALARALF
ncbi:hypothetical protein [Xanthomonas sacchari]|nr:hypothetical protein [Xanthomonas sacchari]MCW0375818.1 hypothetical protein [Xanthomonas sacchari]